MNGKKVSVNVIEAVSKEEIAGLIAALDKIKGFQFSIKTEIGLKTSQN